MGLKKWIFRNSDKALAKELAEECGFDPVVTMVAVARGYTEAWQIEELISDEISLDDPYQLADIDLGADRVRMALENNEKILIYGDYDCDGVTATVLLYEYLSRKNADVSYCLPRRDVEGYGLNADVVRKYAEDGVTLIITVDNGITAFDEINCANELGIDVIVTDHHLPKGELPNAYCVIDPHREDDMSEFKDYAGVGVAFKLVCCVEGVSPTELLPHFAELITLGTVADVMPLVGENRSFVRCGLYVMNHFPRPGVKALLNTAHVGGKEITASSVAFMLSPRINAAGRMGDAQTAARLLLSNNYVTASSLAQELENYNNERYETENRIFREACEEIEELGYRHDNVIVVAKRDWHCGVIGIAAARVLEKYGRPCILFSIEGETAKGSARSINGFDIFEALNSTSDMLVRFGGHELAAGATVLTDKIDDFRKAVNEYAASIPYTFQEINIDCKLNSSALSVDFVKSLDRLEPCGASNEVPLFALTGLTVTKIDMVGKDNRHMRVTATKDGKTISMIAFGTVPAEYGISVGTVCDFAVNLSVQKYNDRDMLSIVIRDIRLSGRDEEKFFNEKSNYLAYESDADSCDYASLLPSREDFAAVFRFVKKFGDISVNGLQNALSTTISADKVLVVVDCLAELGIFTKAVTPTGEMIEYVDSGIKVDLERSQILHSIHKKRE